MGAHFELMPLSFLSLQASLHKGWTKLTRKRMKKEKPAEFALADNCPVCDESMDFTNLDGWTMQLTCTSKQCKKAHLEITTTIKSTIKNNQ